MINANGNYCMTGQSNCLDVCRGADGWYVLAHHEGSRWETISGPHESRMRARLVRSADKCTRILIGAGFPDGLTALALDN